MARHDYAPTFPYDIYAKLHELPPHTLRYYLSQDLGFLRTHHVRVDTSPDLLREHENELSWTVSVTISVPVQKENEVCGREASFSFCFMNSSDIAMLFAMEENSGI